MKIAFYPELPSIAISGMAGGCRYNQRSPRHIHEHISSINYVHPLLTPAYIISLPVEHRPTVRSSTSIWLHWLATGKRWAPDCISQTIRLMAGYAKLTIAYARLFRKYDVGSDHFIRQIHVLRSQFTGSVRWEHSSE